MRLPAPVRPPSTRRAGPGPVSFVVVPGLGLSVDGWRAPLRLLAPAATGLALALPAFGRPAAPGDALDPVSSADRLATRLDELGVGPAVLVGHSASAQVVAEVARRAPERVAGLVLVGPTTDPRGAAWPRLAARWLRSAAHERAGQVPLLARDYTYSGLVTFARTMDATRRHVVEEALAGTTCPLLVLRGPDDRIAPADWCARLARRPGDSRAETLAAGSHMVPVTHPHEMVRPMHRFLAEHAPLPPG